MLDTLLDTSLIAHTFTFKQLFPSPLLCTV